MPEFGERERVSRYPSGVEASSVLMQIEILLKHRIDEINLHLDNLQVSIVAENFQKKMCEI